MLTSKLTNYMKGYVDIKIEGLALEKFINLCISNNVIMWDIKRVNITTLEAKITCRDFKKMRSIVRRVGCRVSIHKKNGYPFWMHKLKRRKMLLIGAFFCLLLLLLSSSFILSIEVVGSEDVKDAKILYSLSTSGLKIGSNKYRLNLREIENKLLIDVDELAWVGIEIKGVDARVEVVEKRFAPDKIDKNVPCNVVAKKNGVIEKILSRSGDAVIKVGDIVKKGDTIISGVVQRENMENSRFVHAYGEVFARTYYETVESVNLINIKNEKTGNKHIKRTINIGSIQLNINKANIPYEHYILEKKSKKFIDWRNKNFTVEIITEEYYEADQLVEIIDEKLAKETVHSTAINKLLEEIPLEAEIINTTIDFTIQDDVLYGKVIIEALEDIAIQKTLEDRED